MQKRGRRTVSQQRKLTRSNERKKQLFRRNLLFEKVIASEVERSSKIIQGFAESKDRSAVIVLYINCD